MSSGMTRSIEREPNPGGKSRPRRAATQFNDAPPSQPRSPVRRRPETAVLHHQEDPGGALSLEPGYSATASVSMSSSRGDSCARAAPSRAPVAVPKVVSPLCELFFRVRRLLWTFWRRRQLLKGLGATAASAAIVCHAKTLKLRQNRWAPTATNAAAVLAVGVLWFLLITALVGAPGNSSANLAESEGQPEYYKRVSGVGVGPSLYDRWLVRDIKLAITDWDGGDLAGGEGKFGAQRGGAKDGAVAKRIRQGGRAKSEGDTTDRWSSQVPSRSDVRVNRIATGPLVAENTTRTKTDLLITIFSGTTRVSPWPRYLSRNPAGSRCT